MQQFLLIVGAGVVLGVAVSIGVVMLIPGSDAFAEAVLIGGGLGGLVAIALAIRRG